MKIYTTKENIEKLEKNHSDYHTNEKQIEDAIISYENTIRQLEEEIDVYIAKEWAYQQEIEELKSQISRYQNTIE